MDHEPVLADAVVDYLGPPLEGGGIVVDATLGRGGHARRLLQASPQARLVGIDRDPDALAASRAILSAFEERIVYVRAGFAHLAAVLERLGIAKVCGVLFDLGVASPQFDSAERGFSFRHEGPLDMRMDPEGPVAADDVVNRYPEGRLAGVIARYGEERFAPRIARRIVRARPVSTTTELAEIVKEAIPAATRRTGGHPARRTFQAIRMEVNDELGQLELALPAAIDALEPQGRAVVISYHSLEDRMVKRTFAEEAKSCVCPPDFPVCRCGAEARVRVLTRRPIRAPEAETAANPRASAAKLRAAERLASGEDT